MIVKFCDKLLQLRRARRLTQKDVAAACGITRQTYSGYESGERYPKKKEMYQVLADFFESMSPTSTRIRRCFSMRRMSSTVAAAWRRPRSS